MKACSYKVFFFFRFSRYYKGLFFTCSREKVAWVVDLGEAEVGVVLAEVAGALEGGPVEAWDGEMVSGDFRMKLNLLSQLTNVD